MQASLSNTSLAKTLVIQSHRQPLPFSWLESCMDSVVSWCRDQGYEYRFYGDEIFERIDPVLREKFAHQKVILTDLARLEAIKEALHQDYDRVIWLDADFLIFAPEQFQLPELWELPEAYMLGREVWIQQASESAAELKSHIKVHNAFLLFDRGNSFLDFYADQAERFLRQCQPSVPPQFIGPKLLTALHNVIQCPVMESAGMLCPLVIQDLLVADKKSNALDLMRKRSKAPLAAANLCSSSVANEETSNAQMAALVEKLLADNQKI